MDRNYLRDNIIFWSRLGMGLVPVTLDENGDPVIYDKNFSQLRFHQAFYEQGIKLHSFILNSGWVGDGKFNYSTTDATMDAAIQIGPEAKLIPRIKLDVTVDWCKNHPEEVFVYPNGPRDVEGIRALVGTPEHDYLGYEAPNGIYMGDPEYQRPNVNGKICMQSFSSDKWLEDAKEALQKLILHLEEKYPNRIIGYHIAYGISGETMLWGRMDRKYGDYGITNQKKFKAFLKERYGIEAEMPMPDKRYSQKGNMEEFLRVNNDISRYYDEFTNEVNSHAAEYFCKAVKEVAPDRLTGVFYGYFLGVRNIAYVGHTEIGKLIDSPYVDFFAAPKLYYRCRPGDAGGEFACTQSINMKKVWVDECDNRTHLAENVPEEWRSNNLTQTENALTRELAKNLSHDSGLWYMDLGGGWYASDEIMKVIGKLNKINERIRVKPHESISDILVIIDEKFISMTSVTDHYLYAYTTDFLCNMRRSGSLLDVYRLADIEAIDLSRYKLIIFSNTLKLSSAELEYIRSKTKAAFCFNYAAGCVADGRFSFENTKAVTGFELCEVKDTAYDMPALRILNEENYIRKGAKGELAYKIVDERLHVMNAVPYLDIASMREIERLAGCHNYCDADYTVYADNRFLAVIASNEGFAGKIDFGDEKKWYEVNSNTRGEGNAVDVNMKPYETLFYIFE